MADYAAKTAREILGPERFILAARASMGGEDFSYYLQKTPGCFFFVGVEPPGKGPYPSLHNDRYDFSDDAVGVGMRMFVGLVTKFIA